MNVQSIQPALRERNKRLSIRDTFNCADVSAQATTQGFADETHPLIPKLEPSYVFSKRYIRDVLAFLKNPLGDGLFLAGHYGCGKTSLPLQIAARMNWPVVTVDGSNDFDPVDMIGQPTLANGSSVFVHGPLVTAMLEGHIFIFNEIDSCRPGALTAIHDVLEGRPLTIAMNGGEVIKPHKNFRFIATGNSVGGGDSTGLYQGVSILNVAFMDRFQLVHVDYPPSAVEEEILENVSPKLPRGHRDRMVRVANEIRALFIDAAEGQSQLTVTLSTRTLLRWAIKTLEFRSAKNPIRYGLRLALTNKCEPSQAQAIEEIARSVWGDEWNDEGEDE